MQDTLATLKDTRVNWKLYWQQPISELGEAWRRYLDRYVLCTNQLLGRGTAHEGGRGRNFKSRVNLSSGAPDGWGDVEKGLFPRLTFEGCSFLTVVIIHLHGRHLSEPGRSNNEITRGRGWSKAQIAKTLSNIIYIALIYIIYSP